jgi:hypothetical protein
MSADPILKREHELHDVGPSEDEQRDPGRTLTPTTTWRCSKRRP